MELRWAQTRMASILDTDFRKLVCLRDLVTSRRTVEVLEMEVQVACACLLREILKVGSQTRDRIAIER